MRKTLFLLLISVFIIISARAQVAGYSFSQANTTYTEISTGTILGDSTSDEQRFLDPSVPLGSIVTSVGPGLPIGFNFVYNGNTYDVFAVNNNGWICFGQSSLAPNPVNMSSTSYILPISTASTAPAVLQDRVSIFGRNIAAQGGAQLRYDTIGIAPFRTLVIQWKGYRRNNQIGENFNFQIRLYESTNVVEFVYGTIVLNTTPATAPQVGLRGSANTDYNNRTSTTDWSATSAGVANNATIAISNTIFPPSGLVFRWTPPVIYQYDAGITAINNPGAIAPIGINNINVTIKNYGTDSLTDASIAWTVDGVLQTPYTYSNAGLVQNTTDGPLLIGNFNFITTGNHIIKVWTENPNSNTDQNVTNDTAFKNVYVQSYGSIPYFQSFDDTWIDKLAIHDVPEQYWVNTPSTGNNSWRREDDGASASWSAGGTFPATSANSSLHSARFHTNGTITGTTGTLDLFLDFTPIGDKILKFWQVNTGGSDSLTVSMSVDGGNTFSILQKINTNAAWVQYQIMLGASVAPNVVLRFTAKSNAGGSDIGLDEVMVSILTPDDAGILSIDAPGSLVFGNVPVDVTIKNFGTDSLESANIHWSVDGVAQTIYPYSNIPGLPTGSTDGPFNIGNFNFSVGGFHTIKAWTTDPNASTDGDNANDTATMIVYVQEYAPLPFTEDFDGIWINKNNNRDVPTLFWSNTPATGNNSWRRNDDGISAAWTQATLGSYAPGGANSTANSARFHTYYAPSGTTGIMDLCLNFAPIGTKTLQFWYINPSGLDTLALYISSDSGATFTFLQRFDTDTVWSQKTIALGTSTSTATVLRFAATSDYDLDDIGLDRVQVYLPTANDVGATALLSPLSSLCGNTNDSVIVTVFNYGTSSQSNIPVSANISTPGGPVVLLGSLSGPLASASSSDLFLGTINTTQPGNYDFTVFTHLLSDAVTINDTAFGSIFINPTLTIPHIEDFEGLTPLANWNTSFGTSNGHGNTSFVLSRTLSNANPTASAVMNKKIDGVTANSVFSFDYRIVNSPSGAATTLRWDSIFMYLSDDCGATQSLVYLIDTNTHVTSTLMKHVKIPLTSFAGTDVIPSIYAQRGNTVSYYLDFDNIAIYELPLANAGPDQSVCYLDTLNIVSATAANFSSLLWTSTGDGMFLYDTMMNPQYAPGINDITNGTVDLTLTVYGPFLDTVTSVITVTITTIAMAEAGINDTICQGSSTQLSATGGIDFSWYPTVGLDDSHIANPVASPIITTSYTVTVFSSCGTASDVVTVFVDHITAPVIGTDTIVCAGSSVTLDAGSGYDSYFWSTGETTQMITVDTNGIGLIMMEIFVDVTKGLCDASDTVNISFIDCLGIPENNSNADVQIFPNPTNGKVSIVVGGLTSSANLNIFDMQGQLVQSWMINKDAAILLDLSILPKGVYFVKIFNEKNAIVKKLIIQ